MDRDSLTQLIVDMKESLEREIQSLQQEVRTLRTDMNSRLDAVNARLDRQGGMLRAGQTNLVRLNNWSEDMDQLLNTRDQRMDAFEERLRRVEDRDKDKGQQSS